MNILAHLCRKLGLIGEREIPEEGVERTLLKTKYEAFRKLLNANNRVLEVMADMEEKLSGEYLFDMSFLKTRVADVTEGVTEIISRLNEISNDKYAVLWERFSAIKNRIDEQLLRKREIKEDRYVIFLDEADRHMADRIGGKNAHLGEVKSRLHLPVPEGFAVTAYAFRRYVEHNGLMETIKHMLSGLSSESIDDLTIVSRKIRDTVANGEIPSDLADAIADAVVRLKERCGHNDIRVSVRSSALQEDGDFSFAGQYSTFLNVPVTGVLEKYKQVVASLFNDRAVFYFLSKGFQEYDMVMSVGVLQMVNARAGGVAYSRDPNRPGSDDILISAVRGLGVCVVDGTETPDTYLVARRPELSLVSKTVSQQQKVFFCNLDGGLNWKPAEPTGEGDSSLTDSEILQLARYALLLEEHYGVPQDIEWAVDDRNNMVILQARPLRIMEIETRKPIPRYVAGHEVLIDKGVIASKGIGAGKVHVVRTDDDLRDFPDNGVLVARHTSPKYVTVMNRARAIVADFGGTTGHMASLAREFQVPTIVDTHVGTKVLTQGLEVTVDAFNCTIYAGCVNELMEFAGPRDEPFKDTVIFRTLRNVLKWISPLNLHDPGSVAFTQEGCETFHDITRYCHEMAMNEMFMMQDGAAAHRVSSKKLVSRIPFVVYIIDLNGGLASDSPAVLAPKHVRSLPFNAFYRGLLSMKWPPPRPTPKKGIFSMLVHTVDTSKQGRETGSDKSFSFIAGEYMNFSLKLGYHLSTVEAYCGEDLNSNYIRLFFKGGGAAIDRRLRRVRLITEILKALDFSVKVTEDVIDASVARYRREETEDKLETLGKLAVYTKQLDMVMFDDRITDHYIEEFIRKHLPSDHRVIS